MRYTEILQMVNSDPSIALNEKIEYVGGVIPRGCKRRTVTSDTPRKEVVLAEVSGRGFVDSANIRLYSSGNWLAKASLYIYCDEKLSAKVLHSYTNQGGSYSEKGFVYSSETSLSADPLNIAGVNEKVNIPIMFNKTLRIVYNSESSSANSGSSANDRVTVVYGLR